MVNPRDKQTGEIMKCLSCHSRFHLYRSIQCPNNAKAMMAELENDPEDTLNVENVETVFASERDFITSQPTSTNDNSVVDSAATKSVCGLPWYDAFVDYLKTLNKKSFKCKDWSHHRC